MEKIRGIYTHERPHLDEIVAIWLLRNFGENAFPGVSEDLISGPSAICYLTGGGQLPDGKTSAQYEEEGILLIGTGGGRFDEHPAGGDGRKKEHCAATLVAEALGLSDEPSFEKILQMTVNNDLKGSTDPFGIGYIVKVMLEQDPEHPARAIQWVFDALDAKYEEQRRLHHETSVEFHNVADVHRIPGPFGREITVAIIPSDNPQMSRFARSKHGGEAAIVIQKRSSGNVAIMNNQKFGIKMTELVRMIRIAEQRCKKITAQLDWRALEGEGRVEGAEEWWFQEKTGAILNGSQTASDVPPTQLTLKEIMEMVVIAMNPRRFESQRSVRCNAGFCDSSPRNSCPWYGYGLYRCRAIRGKQYAETRK